MSSSRGITRQYDNYAKLDEITCIFCYLLWTLSVKKYNSKISIMKKFNKIKYPFSKSNRQIENVTSIKTNKKEVTKSQIANNPITISTFTEIQYNFRCIETAQDLQALKRKTRKKKK